LPVSASWPPLLRGVAVSEPLAAGARCLDEREGRLISQPALR